uniref:C2H2-type domain-containing protein n=1 Tax=Mandrillus leucophaeus TaxID=9568 RepID=A0A2K5XM40_MANLE
MNEYPKKRKRKTQHPSRYSDSFGISRIADGFNGIFSDHHLKYFDNKDDDSDTKTSNELPKFADGIKARNRNQNYLVPSPVLRILDHTAFSTEKSAGIEICDEECDSPESVNQCSNCCRSPSLNVTAQQKWPLLRADSSGLYKCELCEFNSKYFSDLKQHMILKHKCTDSNVCRVCKESFSTNILLIEHAKLHEEDPCICKYCDYKTVIFENLSQHIADSHFSDHLYWCEQCDEHSCDEQYLCQFCEHETDDPEDLHSHVVNEHYNNGEHGQYSLLSKITFDKCKNFFVWQVCGFRSRCHTNVNGHAAIEHTKIFLHVCDDCGKGFSSMLESCKHLNSHLSEGIYLCQYCAYSTGQIEDLKIHLDFKHSADLSHKCSDCLMRFGNERELSHLPIHETT